MSNEMTPTGFCLAIKDADEVLMAAMKALLQAPDDQSGRQAADAILVKAGRTPVFGSME